MLVVFLRLLVENTLFFSVLNDILVYTNYLKQNMLMSLTNIDLTQPQLIEKEKIPNLSFRENIHVHQHPQLENQLKNATRLGNNHKGKVSILFVDDSGLKEVQTTIWANGSKYICLKGGIWIPKNRILEIKA